MVWLFKKKSRPKSVSEAQIKPKTNASPPRPPPSRPSKHVPTQVHSKLGTPVETRFEFTRRVRQASLQGFEGGESPWSSDSGSWTPRSVHGVKWPFIDSEDELGSDFELIDGSPASKLSRAGGQEAHGYLERSSGKALDLRDFRPPFGRQDDEDADSETDGTMLTPLTPASEDYFDMPASPTSGAYTPPRPFTGARCSDRNADTDTNMAADLASLQARAQENVLGTTLKQKHASPRLSRNKKGLRLESRERKTVGRLDTSTLTRHPLGSPLPPVPVKNPWSASPYDDFHSDQSSVEAARGTTMHGLAGSTGSDAGVVATRGVGYRRSRLNTPKQTGDAELGASRDFAFDIPGKWPQTP